jgi:hypothetical protein
MRKLALSRLLRTWEPDTDVYVVFRDNLITNLIHHLSTAQMIVEEAFAEKREAMMVKDVSWLWRTTFNLAVDGCASWGGGAENVSRLFDICAEVRIFL